MWPAISCPETTGWSKTVPTPFLDIKPRTNMPRPSIGGAICQTSAATDFTPGMRLRSSARLAGNVLKTGLGTFSRMTMTPSIWLRVSPTRLRRPLETLNSPITPRIGTERPMRARIVRSGRVSKFRQAKTPMFHPSRRKGGLDFVAVVRETLAYSSRTKASKRSPSTLRPGEESGGAVVDGTDSPPGACIQAHDRQQSEESSPPTARSDAARPGIPIPDGFKACGAQVFSPSQFLYTIIDRVASPGRSRCRERVNRRPAVGPDIHLVGSRRPRAGRFRGRTWGLGGICRGGPRRGLRGL